MASKSGHQLLGSFLLLHASLLVRRDMKFMLRPIPFVVEISEPVVLCSVDTPEAMCLFTQLKEVRLLFQPVFLCFIAALCHNQGVEPVDLLLGLNPGKDALPLHGISKADGRKGLRNRPLGLCVPPPHAVKQIRSGRPSVSVLVDALRQRAIWSRRQLGNYHAAAWHFNHHKVRAAPAYLPDELKQGIGAVLCRFLRPFTSLLVQNLGRLVNFAVTVIWVVKPFIRLLLEQSGKLLEGPVFPLGASHEVQEGHGPSVDVAGEVGAVLEGVGAGTQHLGSEMA